jgi:elongation factor 3
MVVPLLLRGLREKATATKRQSAVIIDNMSKLVDNPIDAAPFLPLLLPALQKASESVSDPEARSVCERGLNQLDRLDGEIKKVGDIGKTDIALVYKIIRDAIAADVAQPDDVFEVSLQFLASIGGSMIDLSVRDSQQWAAAVTAYLSTFMPADKVAAAAVAIFGEAVKLIKIIPEDEEADDGKELLCDCEFTLAYGTKILLYNTRLKLKRGCRYGLLGPNDCGKTTLMRSMSQDQIEAFPSELRTVFVEADILGELSHLTCTDYVLADERIHADGITREQVRDALRANQMHAQQPERPEQLETLSTQHPLRD